MLSVFKNKKQFTISQENKTRIESEIEKLLSLSDGIYAKVKETPMGYYIKIIIDRNKLNITFENEKANKVPESLTFLLIIDYSYPEQPPKILAKTNVSIIHHLYYNYHYLVLLSFTYGWTKPFK